MAASQIHQTPFQLATGSTTLTIKLGSSTEMIFLSSIDEPSEGAEVPKTRGEGEGRMTMLLAAKGKRMGEEMGGDGGLEEVRPDKIFEEAGDGGVERLEKSNFS